MVPEDIDLSDSPELGPEFFEKAELRLPGGSTEIRTRLQPDVAGWLRTIEGSRDEVINEALREYRERHRRSA
jgi:hypothetical protein